ncbi:MAG: hypothetical protein ACE5PM_08500 [Candidatus Hydrothermarchaeales archaeon]
MDLETLLAVIGGYVLILGVFVYQVLVSRRLFEINKRIYDLTVNNRKILESMEMIQAFVLERVYEGEGDRRVG